MPSSASYTAFITSEALQKLKLLCHQELPKEACGLTACRIDDPERVVSAILPMHNTHPKPEHHFKFDPAEWVRTLFLLSQSQYSLTGFYHSHPAGPPSPSNEDLSHPLWSSPASVKEPFSGAEGLQKLQMWIVSLADPATTEITVFASSSNGMRRLMLTEISV
ncbi:Proteasome lid subunit RPN8/RPN11, contains Jab1/MPN metalloenzyme (JAMM) motif [Paenibacillaceae bacterium GAS479]|nr:Proteasome lid subunit RPN8/RPN11, contains Jab1/MPN metalloenzyme (JAMM) motif [Paenibacillaceae bacterium GAS479]